MPEQNPAELALFARMKPTIDLLWQRHEEIEQKDQYDETAGVLANQIAAQLIKDGFNPHIELVYEETMHPGGRTELTRFMFSKYEHTNPAWVSYPVCVAEGYAFDPVLGEPVPVSEFTSYAFGKEINMKMHKEAKDLKEFLEATGKI